MDQSSSPSSECSISPQTPPANSQPHNPYQRIASRRAIACVTCAKAKTKCDKGLPHCSRCITKGIKCEPRSTRRTSENSYRPNIKKSFVSPKRYNSTSAIPSLNRYNSPRSMPSSRHRAMRAASHIDFRTAVKMSQQASTLSGYPMLTPLPTYNPQAMNDCHIEENMSNQSLIDFKVSPEANTFPVSGRLTPQTPEPIIYQEPITMNSLSESWMNDASWSDDSTASLGLSYDSNMSGLLSTDVWSHTEFANSIPINHMAWAHPQLSTSPQSLSSDLVPHLDTVPPLSISDYSVDNCSPLSNFQDGWTNCQMTSSEIDMNSLVTCAPFVSNLTTFPGTAPIWEDVFIPGPPPY